jgi:hypothetical protein
MKTLINAGLRAALVALTLGTPPAIAQESPGGGIGWEQVAPKAAAPAVKTVPDVHYTGSQVRTFWLQSLSASPDMLIGGDGSGG